MHGVTHAKFLEGAEGANSAKTDSSSRRPAGSIGHMGSRNSSDMNPRIASAVLIGIGLVSRRMRARATGKSFRCAAVAAGQAVAAGATLFVVEAMKMEFAVKAPRAVTVAEVRRRAGEKVALGEVVVTFREGA